MEAIHTIPAERQSRLEMKPIGLWCAAPGNRSWEGFCEAIGTELNSKYMYHVYLKDDANILVVSTPDDIKALQENYSIGLLDAFAKEEMELNQSRTSLLSGLFDEDGDDAFPAFRAMDWPKITSEYSGLLVVNYSRSYDVLAFSREKKCSILMPWYNTLDCNCACIWDSNAISGFSLMRSPTNLSNNNDLPINK